MRIEIDNRADAAYIEVIPGSEVFSTEEIDDSLVVDLDKMRVVIGIEIIGLDHCVTLSQICPLYHVRSDLEGELEEALQVVSSYTFQQNQLTSASRLQVTPKDKNHLEFS